MGQSIGYQPPTLASVGGAWGWKLSQTADMNKAHPFRSLGPDALWDKAVRCGRSPWHPFSRKLVGKR